VTPRPSRATAARLFRIPEAGRLLTAWFQQPRGGRPSGEPNVVRAIAAFSASIRKISIRRTTRGRRLCRLPAPRVPYASFVTANVSSPNTKDLRSLQQTGRARCAARCSHHRARPAGEAVWKTRSAGGKGAPDLDEPGIEAIADRVAARGIDAVIATNTTVSREGVEHLPRARARRSFGAPLKTLATAVVARLRRLLPERVVIIGWAELRSAADAREKLDAGAISSSLYRLVYRGPGLVGKSCAASRPRDGFDERDHRANRCAAAATQCTKCGYPRANRMRKRSREARLKINQCRRRATPHPRAGGAARTRSSVLNLRTASSSRAASR